MQRKAAGEAGPHLDQMAGGSSAAAMVQRRSAPGSLVTAIEYLKLNDRAAGDAIMRHLLAITPPPPHPRLAWHNLGAFYQRFFKQLDRIIYIFDNPPDLAQLVYPQDPYAMVDAVRPVVGKQHGGAVGPWDWHPSVGAALAAMIEEALVASLYRIGSRWLHIAELAGDVSGTSVIVDPEAIPRSHQMDRAVVPALCQQGVLDVLAGKQHKAKPKSSTKPVPQPAGVGLRPVQYVWLGKETHGELWNWVRATSPADATVEEVSAQLFDDTAESHGEKHGDYLAFAMTAAPPLFGLPGHWAIKFDEGKAYAPANVPATTDASENNLVTLGGSSAADDQALREANVTPDAKGAKPVPGTGAAVGALAQDAFSQAMYLKKTLASWHLDKAVDPTLTFLGRRMGELADASKLARWQPVLAGQKDKLSRIGAGIVEVDRAAAAMGMSNKQGADARALRDILRIYADAAGTSHLVQTSETLLQRAAALQATLPLRGVQSATRDLGASADMLRDATPLGDRERSRLSGAATQIDEDSRKLQSRMMRGDRVDPDEIDQVTVNAGEIALKSKVHAIAVQLEALEKAAHDAGDGFFAAIGALFSSDFRGLALETQGMKDSLESVTRDMDWQAQTAGLGMRVENAKDLDDYHRETMRVRKEALARAQGQFATMAANDRIKNFLSKGATLVKWQSFRTACVKLAALIGVSVVGGAIGGMVARGAGGMMMSGAGAAAMEDLSAGAQMIARGSGLVTETAVTSVGQTAIFGDKLSDSFLENMLMSLGSAGILNAIGHQAETLAQVERASECLWAKAGAAGKLVLREGAAITGHAIMGAALGYVSHKIVTGKTQPPPETLDEWLLQGASIAVGRYVGHGIAAHQQARKRLALAGAEGAGRLAIDAEKLAALAKHAEQHPEAKAAMELLVKRHALLTEEEKVLEQLEKSPARMKAAKLSALDIATHHAGLQAQLAEVHTDSFGPVALHTSGLHELIPGALWSGTQKQVDRLIAHVREAGLKVSATKDLQGGKWNMNLEGQELVIEERVERQPGSSRSHDQNSAPHGSHSPSPAEHTGAAARVPGSNFAGTGPDRPDITLQVVQRHAESAALLLNDAAEAVKPKGTTGLPFFNPVHNGDISINTGKATVRVKFALMEAGEDVARHNYKQGDVVCTVFVSSKARDVDVARAIAHELSEIHGAAVGVATPKPALHAGSTSEELDVHDLGRRAEIQVLLYQAERAPEGTPGDHGEELRALVAHLGFDPKTIGTDARAKRILGDDEIARIDEILNKPRIQIAKGNYAAKGRVVGQSWVFVLEVQLPNGRKHLLADGSIQLKPSPNEPGKFVPAEGKTLDFALNNEADVDHRHYRVKLEGAEKLTDYVMAEAVKQFTAEFTSAPDMGGMLAWDNKSRFQHAYAEVMRKDPKLTPEEAANAAILKIPYGSARAAAGYDVTATATGSTTILTGVPPRLVDVPDHVTAIAKPRKK